MKNLVSNRVTLGLITLVLFYVIMLSIFETSKMIIVLNGVIFGCFVAILNAYSKLFWMAVTGGGRPYDQIRQMTLSIILQWVFIFGSIWTSFYSRSMGYDIPANPVSVFIRLVGILAAVLQVTAPDFGLGLFHGRDRKVLWTGIIAGTIAAFAAIYIQEMKILRSILG